jgi:hypothetical protein
MKKLSISIFVLCIFLAIPFTVAAQTYLFRLDKLDVHVFIDEDGTYAIDYILIFTNSPNASPIDFIDLGLPNSNFDINRISAEINGIPIADISTGEYQGTGSGVALALEQNAIQPGDTGEVHAYIEGISRVLYPDSENEDYASAVFSPVYFGSQFIEGNTDVSVTYHLPPGVQPEEPRWHSSPQGFQSEPETGIDGDGRVTYSWSNPQGSGDQQYTFGASFPSTYVAEDSIVRSDTNFFSLLGVGGEAICPQIFCCGFFFLVAGGIYMSYRNARNRKLEYLPPKIAIEGHGIKRGLTAVEAAILLEQPMEKILTMILFSTIKKGAAEVKKQDPLTLQVSDSLPEGLHKYETDFLEAMQNVQKPARKKAMQSTMIDLVNSVAKKMKGFSRKETVAYYKDIVNRAWVQVESAETPEVKSEKFEENMDWTMLDEEYEDRTRDIFRTGPVFIPTWWPRYDPGYGRHIPSTPKPVGAPIPSPGKPGAALPQLPGSVFAASIVNSVQNFSSEVVGNITDFTNGVTQKTNPVPVSSRGRGSSGRSFTSGGCACACACACAGCACACAGGGR